MGGGGGAGALMGTVFVAWWNDFFGDQKKKDLGNNLIWESFATPLPMLG
jgi:hypothetical protein